MPIVMDADRIGRTLTRIAHEIVERNKGVQDLALVGVRRRGVPIAKRLAEIIKDITGHEIPTGSLDITLYRDDVAKQAAKPLVRRTDITFSIDVQNLLDRAPPIVPNPTPLAYDPQVASLVGRFFTVGVRARW